MSNARDLIERARAAGGWTDLDRPADKTLGALTVKGHVLRRTSPTRWRLILMGWRMEQLTPAGREAIAWAEANIYHGP